VQSIEVSDCHFEQVGALIGGMIAMQYIEAERVSITNISAREINATKAAILHCWDLSGRGGQLVIEGGVFESISQSDGGGSIFLLVENSEQPASLVAINNSFTDVQSLTTPGGVFEVIGAPLVHLSNIDCTEVNS
jgi:hypothetical protein